MSRKGKRARRIDDDVPLHVRDIDKEIPKPIGIYAENIHNSVFINNTFVGIPTPIYIRHGKKNFFWNNKVYAKKKRV